jgi:hypothetical protein
MEVRDTNAWHTQDVQFIDSELRAATSAKQTALVLTHFAPLLRGTIDPMRGSPAPTPLSPTAAMTQLPTVEIPKRVLMSNLVLPLQSQPQPPQQPLPLWCQQLTQTESNPLVHAAATHLPYFFDQKHNPQCAALNAWVFGHTRYCVNRVVNGSIASVSNQRGYAPKAVAPTYRPDFVLSVKTPAAK